MEAVVVVRGEDGHVVEMDRVESMSPPPHGGRRTHRLLIGIIGGPLGMLIGGATGLMVGSPCDLEDIDETESALGVISSTRPGWADRTAGGCERAESRCRRPAAMSDLGGTVLRRSVADVGAEIAAAEDAERKPSGKPARSLPAATGSTTRLPSTRSSTS